MTAIILACYNRPAELKKCLESIAASEFPENTLLFINDDASTDAETIDLIARFNIPGCMTIKYRSPKNIGIKETLRRCIDKCIEMGYKEFINLDSDAIVKPTWIKRLQQARREFPMQICTGFNSINKNRDGSDRHPIVKREGNYLFKSSVGGINMAFGITQYDAYIKPSLEHSDNWDRQTCINSMRDASNPIVCLTPSCVQHLATKSSMGHKEEPDTACDFIELYLPDVTLIGADCNHFDKLFEAARLSTTDIAYGGIKLLTSNRKPDASRWIEQIPDLNSKEAYNRFIVRDLYKYVNTSHLLTIQHDGYVLNWKAWQPEFLLCDYIGATWWYKDSLNVGNGGFSLRSRKFMEIVANDPEIKNTYPEDHQLCRTYRPYLEKKYGLVWATEDLANRFSIEAFGTKDNQYSGQFGFHGWNVDFSKADIPHKPASNNARKIPSSARR